MGHEKRREGGGRKERERGRKRGREGRKERKKRGRDLDTTYVNTPPPPPTNKLTLPKFTLHIPQRETKVPIWWDNDREEHRTVIDSAVWPMPPAAVSAPVPLLPLFPFAVLSLLLVAVQGLVCRKEKVSPVGMNFGAMNVECGRYVQHCLKVLMWDGTVVRDCDPLAFCPPDGSKVIKNAEYFCCAGNLCNGKEGGKGRRQMQQYFIILLIIFIGQIL